MTWLPFIALWLAGRVYVHFVPVRVWKVGRHAVGVNASAWDRVSASGEVKLKDGGKAAVSLLGFNVWARWTWPWRKHVA